MCDCEFDPYSDSDDKSYHFKRICKNCKFEWYGLHCPHDGYQNPCPKCKIKPIVIEE